MNQVKTGLFIKEMRRQKNLTQREVAEKLNISEKTVSKWETGNGMPDLSLMLPLCELLDISVNELLSGEKLEDNVYKQKAEENIVSLMNDKTRPKTKLAIMCVSLCLTLILAIAVTLSMAYVETYVWVKIMLILISYAAVFGEIFLCVVVAVSIEIFECASCGKKFVPALSAYILGPHTLKKRYLKCPHCGRKCWDKSIIRK